MRSVVTVVLAVLSREPGAYPHGLWATKPDCITKGPCQCLLLTITKGSTRKHQKSSGFKMRRMIVDLL